MSSSPPKEGEEHLDAETEFVSPKAKYNTKEGGINTDPEPTPQRSERGSSPLATSIEGAESIEGEENTPEKQVLQKSGNSPVSDNSSFTNNNSIIKSSIKSPTNESMSAQRKKSVKLKIDDGSDPLTAQASSPSEQSSSGSAIKPSTMPATMKAKFFKHSLPAIPETPEGEKGYYTSFFERHELSISRSEAEEVSEEIAAMGAELYNEKVTERRCYDKAVFGVNETFQSLLDTSGWPAVWEPRKNMIRNFSANVFKRALAVGAAHLRHNTIVEVNGFKKKHATSNTYFSRADGLMIHVWHSNAEARRFNTCYQRLWQILYENGISCIHTHVSAFITFRGTLISVTQLPPLTNTQKFTPSSLQSPVLHHFSLMLGTALGEETNLPLYVGGDGRYYYLSTAHICPHEFDLSCSSDASHSARLEVYHLIPPLATKREVRDFIEEDCIPNAAQNLLAALKQRDSQQFIRAGEVSAVLHEAGVNLSMLYQVLCDPSISANPDHPKAAIAHEVLTSEMAFRATKEAWRADLRSSKDDDELAATHRLNRLLQLCTQKKSGVWAQVNEIVRLKYQAPEDFTIPLSPTLIKIITARFAKLGAVFDQPSGSFVKYQGISVNFIFFGLPEAVKDSVISKQEAAAAAASETGSEAGEGSPAASPQLLRRRSSFSNMSFGNLIEAKQQQQGAGNGSISMSGSMAFFQPDNEAQEEEAVGNLTRKQTFFQRKKENKAHELAETAVTFSDRDKNVELQDLIRNARNCILLGSTEDAKKVIEVLAPRIRAEYGGNYSSFAAMSGIVCDLGPIGWKEMHEEHYKQLTNLHSQYDSLYICIRLRNFVEKNPMSLDDVKRCIATAKRIPAVDMSFHHWFQKMVCEICVKLSVVDRASDINDMMSYVSRLCHVDDARRTQFIISFRKVSNSLIAAQNVQACQTLKPMEGISLKLHEEKFGENDVQTGVAVAHSVYVAGCSIEKKLSATELRELKRFHQITNSFGSSTVAKLQETLSTSAFLASLGTMTQILAQHGEKGIASRAMHHSLFFTGDQQPVASVKRSVEFLKQKAHNMITSVVRMKLRPEKNSLHRVEGDEYYHRIGTECLEAWAFEKTQKEEMGGLEMIYRKAIKELEASIRAKIQDVCWRDRYEVRRKDRIKEKEEEMQTRKHAQMREAREAVDRLKKKEDAEKQKEDRENLDLITEEEAKKAALVKKEEDDRRQRALDAEREQKRKEREEWLQNEANKKKAQEEEDRRRAEEAEARRKAEEEKRAAAKALLDKKAKEEQAEKERKEKQRNIEAQLRQCRDDGCNSKSSISSEEAIERRALLKLAEKNKSDIMKAAHKKRMREKQDQERRLGIIPQPELNSFLMEEDKDPLRRLQSVESAERQQLLAMERMRLKAIKKRGKDLAKMGRTLSSNTHIKGGADGENDLRAKRREEVMERMRRREEDRMREAEENEKAKEVAREVREKKREELAHRSLLDLDQPGSDPEAQNSPQAKARRKKLEEKQQQRQAAKEKQELDLMRSKTLAEKWEKEKPPRLIKEVQEYYKKPDKGQPKMGPLLKPLVNARPAIDPQTHSVTNDELLKKVHENKRDAILARMEVRRQQRASEAVAGERAGLTAKEWVKRREEQHQRLVASLHVADEGAEFYTQPASTGAKAHRRELTKSAPAEGSMQRDRDNSNSPSRLPRSQSGSTVQASKLNKNGKKKHQPSTYQPPKLKLHRSLEARDNSPERQMEKMKAERRAKIQQSMAARVKSKADLMVAVEKNRAESNQWRHGNAEGKPQPPRSQSVGSMYRDLFNAEVETRGTLPPLPQAQPPRSQTVQDNPSSRHTGGNAHVEDLRKNIIGMFNSNPAAMHRKR